MSTLTIAKEDGLVLLRITLDPERAYTIGRSRSADIRLDAPSISRLHAVLIHRPDGWSICDLDSRRGTWDEQGRIDTRRLEDGAWTAVGSAFLWFDAEHGNEAAPGTTTESRPRTEAGTALLLEGPSPELPRIIRLEGRRPLVLGNTERCELAIELDRSQPVEIGLFPHRDGWRAVSMTGTDLMDGAGKTAKNTSMKLKSPVFAGSLTLTLLGIEGGPARRDRTLPRLVDDRDEVGHEVSVDLEAAARAGRTRPNAA